MFGWFAPKCPLELSQKVWTEYRLRWLADRLGIERMLKAEVITPDAELFSVAMPSSEPEVRALLALLAGRMGIAELPEIEAPTDAAPGDYSARYVAGPPSRIQLNLAKLSESESAVLALIRMLAHHILVGGNLLDAGDSDANRVADLMLVFLGMGVIAANDAIHLKAQRRSLTAMDFGYALALFAYVRGEEGAAWCVHLPPDALDAMKKGLRFLQKTGDTIFRPDTMRDKLRPPAVAEARDRLTSGTPTEQVMTLWQLAESPLHDDAIVELVTAELADREAAVVSGAADALAALGVAATGSIPALLTALNSSHARVRAAAARALGSIRVYDEKILAALTALLDDTNPSVLAATANALTAFAPHASQSVLHLLNAIDAALYRHPQEGSIPYLLLALQKIDADAPARIRAFYEEGNDEHRDHLLELLGEIEPEAEEEEATEEP